MASVTSMFDGAEELPHGGLLEPLLKLQQAPAAQLLGVAVTAFVRTTARCLKYVSFPREIIS